MEENRFDTELQYEEKVFVLVIYDITDNRRRRKLERFLRGYGFRVQKSAFEAKIRKKAYRKLISGLSDFAGEEDSIRVYKIIGKGKVTSFGKKQEVLDEEIIII